MQTLPIELLAYVCEFVSEQDDGNSIRSLNLVSTHLYDISEPYLFRRVVVSGAAQISAFAEQLKLVQPSQRKIRNLFLADSPLDTKSPENVGAVCDNAQLSRNISHILAYASPHIISFAAYLHSQRGPSLIARMFRTSMPNLQNLVISGLYPFPSSSSRFPRLKSLHLDGNRSPVGLLGVAGLEETFPALTSLSVTGIESGAFTFEVEEVIVRHRHQSNLPNLKMPQLSPTSAASTQTPLPPNLRTLVLQAGPKDRTYSEISLLKIEVLMGQLRALQQSTARDDGAELNVHVLDPPGTAIKAGDMKDRWCRLA